MAQPARCSQLNRPSLLGLESTLFQKRLKASLQTACTETAAAQLLKGMAASSMLLQLVAERSQMQQVTAHTQHPPPCLLLVDCPRPQPDPDPEAVLVQQPQAPLLHQLLLWAGQLGAAVACCQCRQHLPVLLEPSPPALLPDPALT